RLGGQPDQAGRKQRRQRPLRVVMGAERGAAGGAVAQMRPELGDLLLSGLAVGDRGQQVLPALALLAGLDAREALEEPLPSLGEAAVDLGVGPAGLLADLAIALA